MHLLPQSVANLINSQMKEAENGSITFKIYSESTDPNTEPSHTTETIKAVFHQARLEDMSNPGLDNNMVNFTATLTSPLTMPETIKNGDRGEATITIKKGASTRQLTGTFHLTKGTQNPHTDGLLGDKFEGYMIRNYT